MEVSHITHLDRVPVLCDVMQSRRLKIARKSADPSRVQHVGHSAAWKHYIRGNVVSESSVTLITNFLSACSAMAKHKDDDEERDDQDQQAENTVPWLAGSAKMSVLQLRALVRDMTYESDDKKSSDNKDVEDFACFARTWSIDVVRQTEGP